jgi:PPM family protein phosphatase
MIDRNESTETLEIVKVPPKITETEATRTPVKFTFAAISDPGKVRTNNEDHFLIAKLGRTFSLVSTNVPTEGLPDMVDEVAYGMVVADGMGGMAAGEKASQLAIRTGVDLVLNSPIWATRLNDQATHSLITRMRDHFRIVDTVVIGEARSDRHLSGMGTTLTFAYLVNTVAFIVHVGDSRAYLCRKGRLEQITRDHTMAQGLADRGAIKPDEVHRHAKRHVLTNFVGGPSSGVEPEVDIRQLEDGDTLLLCTDGLSEMVEDTEINRVLGTSATPEIAARKLVDLALQAGGRDNVTVLVARLEVPPAG